MVADNKDIEQLYALILSLENVDDCACLFEDLCTAKELEQMAQRVKAARLLLQNKTYNQVMEECDISSATLSRVSRCVQYGKAYKRFLTNL